MSYVIVTGNYGFNGKFFEKLPALLRTYDFGVIYTGVFNWFKDGSETTFVARIVLNSIVLDKVLRLFVDGVVCQMHAQVV